MTRDEWLERQLDRLARTAESASVIDFSKLDDAVRREAARRLSDRHEDEGERDG